MSLRDLCMRKITKYRYCLDINRLPSPLVKEIKDDYFIEGRLKKAYDEYEVHGLESLQREKSCRIVGYYNLLVDKVVLLEDDSGTIKKYWANRKIRFIVLSCVYMFERLHNIYKYKVRFIANNLYENFISIVKIENEISYSVSLCRVPS